MHIPDSFREHRPDPLARLIDSCGLGTVVHGDSEGVEASHVPIFRDDMSPPEAIERLEGSRLVTHIARSNPLTDRIGRLPRASVTFLGVDSYVSGNWNGVAPTVPTWNFMAVHLHGSARLFADRDRLLGVLDRTAEIHEPAVGGSWRRGAVEHDLVEELLPRIVGLEITIEAVEGMFKLHQHACRDDVSRVIAGLRHAGGYSQAAVADAMEAQLNCGDATAGRRRA